MNAALDLDSLSAIDLPIANCGFRAIASATIVVVAFAALTGCNLNPGQSGPHLEDAVITPVAPTSPPPPAAPATNGNPAPSKPKRTFGLDNHDPINHWPTGATTTLSGSIQIGSMPVLLEP